MICPHCNERLRYDKYLRVHYCLDCDYLTRLRPDGRMKHGRVRRKSSRAFAYSVDGG
jgi:hypothetical protein